METKHTPGQWKVAEKGCDNLTEKHIAWTNFMEVIGPKNGDTSKDEDSANAKLIAAAPELLEALQFAVKFIKCCPELAKEERRPKGLEKWESVIEKATE